MLRIFERMQTFRRSLGLVENALPLCRDPRTQENSLLSMHAFLPESYSLYFLNSLEPVLQEHSMSLNS